MRSRLLARAAGALVLALAGYRLGVALGEFLPGEPIAWWPSFLVVGACAGFLLAERMVYAPLDRLFHDVKQASLHTILVGSIGLLAALIAASLLAVPLAQLPPPLGSWLPFAAALLLVWAGMWVLIAREHQVLQLIRLAPKDGAQTTSAPEHKQDVIMLDTSAIIDGRIADIAKTGFITSDLVVPRFVLDELRHIADSTENARRIRGRRGFEVLDRLRKESLAPLRITDDITGGGEVDSRLVEIAKDTRAAILTTDYNLIRVAELQGVRVLNINQLAHALKPVLLPGEEMVIQVVQEGREAGQGVGFLDDGTMLVVEGGRKFLGTQIGVEVTRVLQTPGGRIIFAQPKVRAA